MTAEQYLKNLMEQKSGSVRAFATYAKIPYTTVRSILERGILNAKMQNILTIANALDINPETLSNFNESNDSSTNDITPIYNQLNSDNKVIIYDEAKRLLDKQNNIINFDEKINVYSISEESVPYSISKQQHEIEIVGAVSAGTGEFLDGQEHKETIMYHGNIPAYDYAVRVNGDSMTPMFENGQIIFVNTEKLDDIHDGQIIIANLNNEAYVKKIDLKNNEIHLVSLNPKYEPIEVTSDDVFKIDGIVAL